MGRLGNVQFAENADGNAMIPDEGVIEFIAYLMEVEKDTVNKVLTSRIMETTRGGRRGELFSALLRTDRGHDSGARVSMGAKLR